MTRETVEIRSDGSFPFPSGTHIDWSPLLRSGGDLPGKPHTNYTLPSPAHIEGALATLILRRGGAPERVCASHVGTVEHAYLNALAQLGDEDAIAFLASKGFLCPAPLVPRDCPDCTAAAPMVLGQAGPTHMLEVYRDKAGDCSSLTVTLDPRPVIDAILEISAALRALAGRLRDRVAGLRRQKVWTGELTFVNPNLHRFG